MDEGRFSKGVEGDGVPKLLDGGHGGSDGVVRGRGRSRVCASEAGDGCSSHVIVGSA